MAEINVALAVFIVGSSREKNGKFSWCDRTIDIRAKHSAVAHRHRDTVFHSHRIGINCKSKWRNESQDYGRAEQDSSIDSRHIQANHSFSATFPPTGSNQIVQERE